MEEARRVPKKDHPANANATILPVDPKRPNVIRLKLSAQPPLPPDFIGPGAPSRVVVLPCAPAETRSLYISILVPKVAPLVRRAIQTSNTRRSRNNEPSQEAQGQQIRTLEWRSKKNW